jgi:glyoxylase-like metal-dependent hydrolase (beta-lactamase superfamily II)
MAIVKTGSDKRRPPTDRLTMALQANSSRYIGAFFAAIFIFLICTATRADATPSPSRAPGSLRLYVLDCGAIHVADTARYELRRDEVDTPELSVPCFLAVHPKGALIWDVGAVPDSEWQPTGKTVVHHLSLPDGQTRDIPLKRSLGEQLSELGYPPSKISYLALSHYHYDHTANANLFTDSTWLVRSVERNAMFATPAPGTTRPDTYARLKNAKTIVIDTDQYDVFGDDSVVIKFAPGHTPGHQMLLLRLKNTGPVLLSGDLYHFPQERTLNRFPVFEFDKDQTRRTRREIEEFLKATGASLWIQHDFIANGKLRKSPAFYD